MKVFLAATGIFGEIGGGQRFYANLIAANSSIEFYFSGAPVGQPLPRNAHPLRLGNDYRRYADDLALGELPGDSAAVTLRDCSDRLALLLDIAAAAAAGEVDFDIVDIPDFLPLGAYLPECLSHFRVSWDRVALSMHGTVSMALADNWYDGIGGLEDLVEDEELLYRRADLRYGIGRRYVAGWAAKTKLPARLLDIGKLQPPAMPPMDRERRGGGPPDLCFVGRQERWKGPDLFLQLCSQLPSSLYARIRLLGPPVDIHGHRSMPVLRALAANRGLDVIHEIVPPERMATRLRDDRMVVVLPSRRDTFNLVAIEALLQGCPTAVSAACGACDYLDAAYTGLPYIKFDPERGDAAEAIASLLADYDGARARLAAFLANTKRRDCGAELAEIYASPSTADAVAQRLVGDRFAVLAKWLRTRFQPPVATALAAGIERRCGEILTSQQCNAITAEAAASECRRALEINDIAVRIATDGDAGRGSLDEARDRLNQHVSGGSRVALYRLMAEWERRRGNELLYATYWLRVMRLSGDIPPAVLREVMAILDANGFPEEAHAAELIDCDDEGVIYRYLKGRRDLLRTAPVGGIAVTSEFNRPPAPRVSVLVSVYRGANKIETFVSGLERFTEASKLISEVIFIDSASPDDTESVLTERLRLAASRGIGSVYLRTDTRETIQRAWNRGIAAARGGYLAFLGVDEMIRPDTLAKLAEFLDRRPDVDWVQGSAVITEVNAAGSYLRDVMAYDRRFEAQQDHYLECCYVSYVGALYRKTIHDKAGFYDDSFRAAGDTEFKNRALPLIAVETLPETLGTFLNYPEPRTTQSAAAEIEDSRAWYLHRTAGGVRCAFERVSDEACVRQFRRALHYKKSYMDGVCTDVDYALAIAAYAKRHRPEVFAAIEAFVPGASNLQRAYRRLDRLVPIERPAGFQVIADELQTVWSEVAQAHRVHRQLGLAAEYRITNDNRWHQHHLLWHSEAAGKTTETAEAEIDDECAADHAAQGAAAIARGEQVPAGALGAFCALAAGADGAAQLARYAETGARLAGRKSAAVLADIEAVVASYLGCADAATMILSPALPFDIVDADGQLLPEATRAARRLQAGSWRMPQPVAGEPQWLRLRLDAALAVSGHPGVIGFAGFYPPEGEGERFRWTGPGTASTIVLPLGLTGAIRAILEFDALGSNTAEEDFTLTCNGIAIRHEMTKQGPITRLTGDLPATVLTGPRTELTFTIRECSRAEPPDRRVLGVVFRSLTLLLGPPVQPMAAKPKVLPQAIPA